MKRCMLLILLCAACASLPGRTAAPLRVMTYNIHAGKDAAQVHNLERVAGVIKGANADIVLLQEVDRGTQRSAGEDHVATLERLTGMHAAFVKSLDYQGGLYGIAVLSRFPLDSAHVIPLNVLPKQERSGTYEPRVGLHVIVRTPAGPLHVVNTHIDPAAEPTYRHQEVMGLLAHIRNHGAAAAPLVFGGDLNARPTTPEIAALSLSFADSWAQCGNGGAGYTFPAHAPDRRIDYLMLRQLSCTQAEVVETQASDHRPFLITIQF
jgi:endonuclease/exonuclease/phosphatase family metal-dependent hydrolase